MTGGNLITIVGAGGALSLAGFGLLGGAACVALNYFIPSVHLSVWLLIVGVVMLVLGLTLVERGGAKTVEKVETELSIPNVVGNFPWAFVGLGAGAALLGYLIFRRRSPVEVRKTEVKPIYVATPAPPTAAEAAAAQAKAAESPKRTTLTDILAPLGAAAAQYATSVGMKALGIPSPTEIVANMVKSALFGDSKRDAKTSDGSSPRPSMQHNGYESAMRRT